MNPIPAEKLPKELPHRDILPRREHILVTTNGKDAETQTRVHDALRDWNAKHRTALVTSWATPECDEGLINIYLSMDTIVAAAIELVRTLDPIVAPAKVTWRRVPARQSPTLAGLRYEGDVFIIDLTVSDGRGSYEFGTPDNKEHPRRLVSWGQYQDEPHTVSFTYWNARKGHYEGLTAHVEDLALLDLLRPA